MHERKRNFRIRWRIHHDRQVDEKINDAYFAKAPSKGPRSAEEEFFSEGKPKEKAAFPESKAADQKAVDAAVVAAAAGSLGCGAGTTIGWTE